MSQKKQIKKPRFTLAVIYEELSERTNVPLSVIERIMDAYTQMVEESISNRVEIPFGKIGRFTFTISPPHDYVEWNGFYQDKPVIYYKNKADGHIKIGWKFSPTFKQRFKEYTKIPYGSMPSLPDVIELRPRSEIKMDFNEVMKESVLRKLLKAEEKENQEYERLNKNE